MEKLANYVEQLILKTDCVMIPGFGGFLAIRKPASFSEKSNVFFPPKKEILFNNKLDFNDNTLVSHIMNHEFVAQSKAEEIVANSIIELNNSLNRNKNVSFGNIGEFLVNEKGIEFASNTNISFFPETYGLSSFHFPEIKLIKNTSAEKKEETPVVSINKMDLRLKRIVAVAACLFFLLLPSLDTYNNQHCDFAGFIPSSWIIPTTDNSITETNGMLDESVVSNTPEEAYRTESVNSPYTYHVIIASLPSKKHYEQYLQETKQRPEQVTEIQKDGRYRVSVASFPTENDGLAFIESFVKEYPQFADAWVLEVGKN